MSSDEEEEQCAFYGKPLEQYDEDSIPKRRPISVEEQTARDAQGRRRFHGAFTGGFSAGFYNTVGSLEGWKPTEFKSSRLEKAGNKIQKPEDFMDDEDVGEFGIAPQTVKATKDYNTSKKRKRKGFSDGPIPGEPVLQTLIENNTETIGYLLLRHMGFKHSPNEEEGEGDDEQIPQKRVYGCEMPKPVQIKPITATRLHETYELALKNPKSNTFGLGYSRLEKQHGHLMTSTNLIVKDRNNKTLSIAGQAFGVGAFEEDDDDIYSKEDMSNYDFEMTKESKKVEVRDCNNLTIKMFVSGKICLGMSEIFPPPNIPKSFTGKYKVRKSRFEPVAEDNDKKMNRWDKKADYRAEILGEVREKRNDNRVEVLSDIRFKNCEDQSAQSENSSKFTSQPSSSKRDTQPVTSSSELPLGQSDQSSSRLNPIDDNNSVRETKFKVEPPGASGLIFDRFVSASKSEDHTDIMEPVQSTQHGTNDMREAARMKMFGALTRISTSWIPNSLVCKRFNVPEPVFSDVEMKPRKRTRNLIFENETFTKDPESLHSPGLQMRKQNSSEDVLKNNDVIDVEMIPLPNNKNSSIESNTFNKNKDTNNENVIINLHEINLPESLEKVSKDRDIVGGSQAFKNEKVKNTDIIEREFQKESIPEKNPITLSQDNPKKSLDPTEKLDISKNANLFKAIFQDSDDDDEDISSKMEEDKKDSEEELKRDSAIKEQILSDDLFLPKIKPIKEGILSNVDLIVFKKPVKEKIVEKPAPDLYGPKLPEIKILDSKNVDHLKKIIIEDRFQKDKKINDEVEDEWVVKGEESNRKDHKHKKKKKHKKKHKHKRD